jgi:hypothetical protein
MDFFGLGEDPALALPSRRLFVLSVIWLAHVQRTDMFICIASVAFVTIVNPAAVQPVFLNEE